MEVVALADIVLLVGMAAMEAAHQLVPTGHRQLAVEAAEVVVVRTKQTSTVPALGSIMAAAEAAVLVCLALAATAQVVAEDHRAVAVARLEALVGLAGRLPVVAMQEQEAHTVVALAGLATTKTTAHMGLLPTALSVLSASSGVLVAPIRLTPQTSN